MTADQHIKNAYSELLKAADVVKQEVAQLRSNLQGTKHTIEAQIVLLEEQARFLERQMRLPDNANQANELKSRMDYLHRQMNDKRREMNDEIRRIEDLIKQKERDSATIQMQARTVSP